jgi:hypothetical protein
VIDLYRLYDADDTLLYVGISLSALTRAGQHRGQQPWWHEVARVDIEHLATDDRREAERLEQQTIWSERPLYNKAHNGHVRSRPSSPYIPSDTERAIYKAAIDVMSSAGPTPWAREDIIDAIRDGVQRAVENHLAEHGMPTIEVET